MSEQPKPQLEVTQGGDLVAGFVKVIEGYIHERYDLYHSLVSLRHACRVLLSMLDPEIHASQTEMDAAKTEVQKWLG